MKKPIVTGRGADMFFTSAPEKVEPERQHTSIPVHQRAGVMYPKATYYLPPQLQERLEDFWMEKRKTNRKLTKSDVVKEALELYLNNNADD